MKKKELKRLLNEELADNVQLRRLLEEAESEIIDPLTAPIYPLVFKGQLEELASKVRQGQRMDRLKEWLPLLRYCSRHLSSAAKQYEKKKQVNHVRLPKHKAGQSPAESRMVFYP